MQHSCPPKLVFKPHFLKSVVEVKGLRPLHVYKLWLGVGKGMFPVKYFRSNKASFLCQLHFMEITRPSQC